MTARPLPLAIGYALVRVLVASFALALLHSPAESNWIPDGVALSTASGEQFMNAVVPDGMGGVIAVWRDHRSGVFKVYAQRVTHDGTIPEGWPTDGMPIGLSPGSQGLPIAVSDGQGGAIIAWTDHNDGVVRAQRVDPNGVTLWNPEGVRICPFNSDQTIRSMIGDAHGGAIVLWSDTRNEPPPSPPRYNVISQLFAQRVGPAGDVLWPPDGVDICMQTLDHSPYPLQSDGADGALVTWYDERGPSLIQHLDSNGAPLLQTGGVPIAGHALGALTPDGAGGIFSIFTDGPDTQEDLYAQRVSGTGAIGFPPEGVLLSNASYGQRGNAVVLDLEGGAYVAWYDLRNGVDWDIYVQRIDGSGQVRPGWPLGGLAVCTRPGFQIYPGMIPDGSGGVIITWYDFRDSSNAYDIYAQRITPSGAVASGWPADGAALCTSHGNQVNPVAVADGSGGAVVVWIDYRGFADIYAQLIDGEGRVGGDRATPVVFSLVSTDALPDRVRVQWNTVGRAGQDISIDRSEQMGVWRIQDRRVVDGSGAVVHEDRDVVVGSRYGYRVRAFIDGRESLSPEAWVTIPRAPAFTVEGFMPSPARGDLVVAFSLASAEPARLELFDAGGRRVAAWSVPRADPGRRLLRVGHASEFSNGVYLLRLIQGGKSVGARSCILR